MSNLSHDSALTNVLSSDGNYSSTTSASRSSKPDGVIFAATDGVFGYVQSPMEFEWMLLRILGDADAPELFTTRLKTILGEVAGDDFTFSMMSFYCGSFDVMRHAFENRARLLEQRYVKPLRAARTEELMQELWQEYRLSYERYLHAEQEAENGCTRPEAEIINDYELLQPLQNQDAGFSRWTFAVRNGQEYFLKEFMDPIYPTDLDLSPKLRESRIQECQEFEKKRMRLYQAVDDASDGNAVRIIDFFRHGSRYYIVTPKIVKAQISFDRIVALPLYQRALLCRSMAHTVMRLHKLHFVHSDIKETNIILCPARNGNLTTKLIDFDASFFEDDPPVNEDELGGDQVYLSPEACRFLFGEEVQLTCAMDVFSLGLLFHQYLTGKLPDFDTKEYFYAHEAVLDDQVLGVAPYLDKTLRDMLPDAPLRPQALHHGGGLQHPRQVHRSRPCKTGTVPASMLQMAERLSSTARPRRQGPRPRV